MTLQESSWRRLRCEPLDVSDLCRWSRITSLWSALNTHSGVESVDLGANAACFPNNRLCPTWCRAEGGGSAPCGTPRLNLGVARIPVFLFCYQNHDMAAIAHMSSWRRPPPTPKTQPLLHRRLANWGEAYQSRSDQILLQNKRPREAFLWAGGR